MPIAFLAMMAQVPLVSVSAEINKRTRGTAFDQLGNYLFWISFCFLGQPLAILGEMHTLCGEVGIDGSEASGASGGYACSSSSCSNSSLPEAMAVSAMLPSTSEHTPACGYSGQRGWLTRGTIRENIAHGKEGASDAADCA